MLGKAFGISVIVLTAPFWTFAIGAVVLQFAGGVELVRLVFEPALKADIFLITMYITVAVKSIEAMVNFIILMINNIAKTNWAYWNLDPFIDKIISMFKAWAGID